MSELTVKDRIDERSVKATKQHQSFEEEHAHRTSEHNHGKLIKVSSLEFDRCHYVFVALFA
jgi:hypothetical protein